MNDRNNNNKNVLDSLDEFMNNLTKNEMKKRKRKRGERLDIVKEDEEELEDYKKNFSEYNDLNLKIDRTSENFNSDDEIYAAEEATDKLNKLNQTSQRSQIFKNEILLKKRKKEVDELPIPDHSSVGYMFFERNRYNETKEVTEMKGKDIIKFLKQIEGEITGKTPPKPCLTFSQFGLSPKIYNLIKSKFDSPTGIQSCSFPIIKSGRDLMAIAQTGSGKTLAYILPLIEKLINLEPQFSPKKSPNGPFALILAPTHELSKQICQEAVPFTKILKLKIFSMHGGESYFSQGLVIKKGIDIIVGTPGRIINLIKKRSLSCHKVCFFILDEADRMLEMGFKKQIISIANQIRPDRQTSMFSATFPKDIQFLANALLKRQIKVIIGKLKAANKNIKQIIHVMLSEESKLTWLLTRIQEFIKIGKVLCFVSTIKSCMFVQNQLQKNSINCESIHGDLNQSQRKEILKKFKEHKFNVLVATDIAARGIHINGLKTVVNLDGPRNLETHINRIGRTGRAGEIGTAHTLLTKHDKRAARFIRFNLKQSGQFVSKQLNELAQTENGQIPDRFSRDFINSNKMQMTAQNTNKNFNKSNSNYSNLNLSLNDIKTKFSSSFVSSKNIK